MILFDRERCFDEHTMVEIPDARNEVERLDLAEPPKLGEINRSYKGDIETIAAKAL